MTTPKPPVDAPLTAEPGWDDERLAAAFLGRAARVVVPADLVPVTMERLRPVASWWRRLVSVGALAVLLVTVVGGGLAMLGGAAGLLGGGVAAPTSSVDTGFAPSSSCDEGLPETFITCESVFRLGSQAGARVDGVRVWLTSLGAVRSSMAPAQQTSLPDDLTRVWVMVFEGRWRCCPNAIDEDGQPMPASTWTTWLVVVEADREGTGFIYLQDWSDRTVPQHLPAAVVPAPTSSMGPDAGWPPAGARLVDLESGSAGSSLLAVRDLTGTLGSVRAATAQELGYLTDSIPARDVRLVALTDGGVLALWNASTCDVDQVLAIASDGEGMPPSSMTLRGASGACGELTVRRGVWMSFSEDFDVSRVIARDLIPPATDPEPTAPAWGPWPPDGAEVIELANDHPNDPGRVAIVDLSGELVDVRAATAQDGRFDGPDEGFFRDPTGDGRYRLRWGTTICDREMTVTIEAEVARIVIDHAPRDGCDAMGIGRELVLVFSRDVDPASVAYVHNRAVLLPEPPPEPTVTIVDLVRDDKTDQIVVTDHTGSLMDARPAVVADVPVEVRIAPGVRLARLEDGGTVVLWDGSMCDSDFSITIEAHDPGPPDRITVRNVAARACRLALIQRAVWLDLGPVNLDSIELRHDVAAAPTLPEALGLGVMDVQAALAVQARPGDDTEIAVRGWIWRLDPATLDCLVFERTEVEELFFGQGCRSDSLMATEDGTFDDPTLSLVLGQGASAVLPYGIRVEVVLVGHFDDRRSSECTAPRVVRCADMFWVDAVSLPTSRDWTEPVRGGDPATHTHDDAWERVRGPDEDPLIALSVNLMTGSGLQHLEPAAVGSIPLERWNWHITAYEPSSGRLRTFVIPDSVLDNIEGVVSYEVIGDEVGSYFTIID